MLPTVVEALNAATRAPIPATALPLDATALPFRAAEGAGVAIIAAPRPSADAPTSDQIQVRATLVDQAGEIKATTERRVGGTIGRAEETAALRVPLFLRLPRGGRYQVRVAANSAATSASGSVFLDIEVPDFARDGLSMSGVAWGVSADSPSLRLAQLEGVFPFQPTTRRSFRATDHVEAAVRVYANRVRAPILATCRVTAAGSVLDITEHEVPAVAARAATGALVECPVRVHQWPVGNYLLEISTRAASHSVARTVRFSID